MRFVYHVDLALQMLRGMSRTQPQTILAGAFYALLNFYTQVAPAQVNDPTFALEQNLKSAYASPARAAEALDTFEQLKRIYLLENRPQELAYLEMAYGSDVAAAEIERKIERQLIEDPIQPGKVTSLGPSTELVKLRHGLRAIYRTADPFDSRLFEVALYQISRILGFQTVPVTVVRPSRGVLSVIKVFVEDALPGVDDLTHAPYPDEPSFILDYLTQQMNRGPGTYGVRPAGQVVSWTNNAVFDSLVALKLRQRAHDLRSPRPSAARRPAQISAAAHAGLRRLKKILVDDPAAIRHLSFSNAVTLLQNIDALLAVPTACSRTLSTHLTGPVD